MTGAKSLENTRVCGGTTKQGTACQRPAGWGTNHPGEGHCKLHGGASVGRGRPMIHGRYSVKARAAFSEKYNRFMEDPEPGNLLSEVALLRALLQDFLDRLGKKEPSEADSVHIMNFVGAIGKEIERFARIMNQTALTEVEVMYLIARFTDIAGRYIQDPAQRAAFAEELQGIAMPQPRNFALMEGEQDL